MGPFTVIKASQTNLQAEESGHAMFCLECSQIEVVVAFHPDLPERLKPRWCEHLDVVPTPCDITILGAFDIADNEVGYV